MRPRQLLRPPHSAATDAAVPLGAPLGPSSLLPISPGCSSSLSGGIDNQTAAQEVGTLAKEIKDKIVASMNTAGFKIDNLLK